MAAMLAIGHLHHRVCAGIHYIVAIVGRRVTDVAHGVKRCFADHVVGRLPHIVGVHGIATRTSSLTYTSAVAVLGFLRLYLTVDDGRLKVYVSDAGAGGAR